MINITELNNKHWATNNKYWLTPKKAIEQLIYHPARLQYRTFYYDILNYYYRNIILSLKNGATLDDLRLSTKYWTWYFNSIIMPTASFNSNVIPITFKEFLDNRSLSRYIQKASKEINYGNSNSNNNNN